ncbi:hypothetical protein GCM10010399_63610 [Dactylosporangium fulvum]|uniref:Uncharacterized protein n=1 Tax=Dactylosporangium fulvum TaxID=53359 RepID=A0ABY5W9N9_9ACTN|nr:hypothetical protein [Dactylosporangium fulvum]UWP85816.1 hypothetical protein Dfulv_16850 [Dactylosporangium fulvum]
MSARKTPPSRRQHVELGARLQGARDAVFAAVQLTSASYPVASRPAKAAVKALRVLDELRMALDDVSYQELRGDDWSPTIYYAANCEVRAAWLAANPVDDEPAPGGAQ